MISTVDEKVNFYNDVRMADGWYKRGLWLFSVRVWHIGMRLKRIRCLRGVLEGRIERKKTWKR